MRFAEGAHLRYHAEDHLQKIEDVLKIDPAKAFTDTQSLQANLGYTLKTYWFQISLQNSGQTEEAVIFEVAYPRLEILELYALDSRNEVVAQFITGTDQPFWQRPINHSNFAFPLHLAAGERLSLYLKTHTHNPLRFPVQVWETEEFRAAQQSQMLIQGLYYGAIAIMVIYNMFVFFGTGNRSYIYYCLFVVSTATYLATDDGLLLHYVFNSTGVWNDKVSCLAILGANIFGIFFAANFLRLKESDKFIYYHIRWIISVLTLSISVTFIFPHNIAGIFYTLLSTLVSGLLVTIIIRGFWRRQREAYFYAAAWGSLLVGTVVYGMLSLGLIDSNFFTERGLKLGSLVEVTILSFALADRLNQLKKSVSLSNFKLKDMNDNLEAIVTEKTQEVRSLLDHIPQGVFSIEENLKISKQYSAHLPELLGTDHIAGCSFQELILDHTPLLADEKDRITQTLNALVGEDEISFEANGENLPKELMYHDESRKQKNFSLTWNIEANSRGIITRILVTVLDITLAKSLEREVERQQSEMHLVKELIDCGAGKFAQFLGTVKPLLEESERLIDLKELNADSVKILFVNAHTAKGAARTLGLSMLANSLHEAEHSYSQAIQNPQLIDLQQMKSEMSSVLSSFDRYKKANSETLGRKDDLRYIQVDKHFLAQHCQLMLNLQLGRKSSNKDLIESKAKESIDHLIKIVFQRLPSIIEDCFTQTSRIAKDLGKPVPKLDIQVVDMLIPQQIEDVLRKVAVHLIRNAMDHGIEGSEERVLAAKSPIGKISVEAIANDNQLQISIKDDGRGLAIGKLRERGIKSGKLNSGAPLDMIAHALFEMGVSTAQSVSHISGRGVGMDAVKRFVEEAGGCIKIVLGEKMPSADDYYAFQTVISFPLSDLVLLKA